MSYLLRRRTHVDGGCLDRTGGYALATGFTQLARARQRSGRPTLPERRRKSQTKLAVRSKADKLKGGRIRLAVNQHKVGAEVTIAVIFPIARQRMIQVALGQRLIRGQQVHDRHQKTVQLLAKLPGFLAPIIAFESICVFNSPHSGSREGWKGGPR